MVQDSIFVGLDVHKDSIAVAVADGGGGDVRGLGIIPNSPHAVRGLIRRLGPTERISACYEAGPCGYRLYRYLTHLGVRCLVVAPSLVPAKPGDRVKTDRRDATKLARLLRSRDLTPVWVPDESHEALRDLTRAREDARHDLVRARHRLGKLLLRQGVRPPRGVTAWTQRHRTWLQSLQFSYPAQQVVFTEYLLTIDQLRDRLDRLDTAIADAAVTSPYAPLIAALQTLRGIGLISAAALVAEGADLTRFRTARELMAYAGIVPSEYSTGRSQHRGAITKTGNAHPRYVLVEAAWHYRHRPALWGGLRQRQIGQSETVKAIAWDAQVRLHRRFHRLTARGKPAPKAVVAIARELLGFMWAIGQGMGRSGAVAA